GFNSANIRALGGNGFKKGGAGTVYLRDKLLQIFGDLIVDNGGLVTSGFSTPLRSVAPGVSTALSANSLTSGAAVFPVPDALTGALGLIGLSLNPNTAQSQSFTITDNTATVLFTDPADGDMTLVASPGQSYIGEYTFDNVSVLGAARVETKDNLFVTGTLFVDPTSALSAHNVTLP
ncbi:MAG: hypothetical protein ACRD1Z_02825, partial [Vicinamibacteria bacterium]